MKDFDKFLREQIPGYHFSIEIYPSGGIIDAVGCEECGTEEKFYASESWKIGRGESMAGAVERLKQKCEAQQ